MSPSTGSNPMYHEVPGILTVVSSALASMSAMRDQMLTSFITRQDFNRRGGWTMRGHWRQGGCAYQIVAILSGFSIKEHSGVLTHILDG